jgi:hypothetical protein
MATATHQTRQERAEALAADVARWEPQTTRNGVVFRIPSQTEPGVYHTATHRRCTCWDARSHTGPCKHRLAINILLRNHGLL